MRVQNTSAPAIDNIFIDVSQFESYTLTPIINSVSDHDEQLLIISPDDPHIPKHKFNTTRKINMYTISDFIDKLRCKSWDTICNSEDVNEMAILFLIFI